MNNPLDLKVPSDYLQIDRYGADIIDARCIYPGCDANFFMPLLEAVDEKKIKENHWKHMQEEHGPFDV